MARQLRVEYPGAYYHVMNRGDSREDLFKDDRDREKFIEYLEKSVERFSLVIHTYCLMPNHYHLLIETPEGNLSRAIQWISVSYAAYFNRKHQRSGHLFKGRFKAILIDADDYLKPLSRYIHLNPVRAKLVSSPLKYGWSSYRVFAGKMKAPEWLEINRLLAVFGGNVGEAIKNYRRFVEKVNLQEIENPGEDAVGGLILGNQKFAKWVKHTFLSDRDDEKEIPQLRNLKPKIDVGTVVFETGKETGCTPEQILEKGRKKNKAREIAIYLARDFSGLSGRQLGEYFGGVTGASITMVYDRVDKESRRDKSLRNRIDRIKKRIFNI